MRLPKLPYDVPSDVMQKAANIRLAIFDVDGVLTDGKLHYGDTGEQLKVFNALDGHGLKMLQKAGVHVAIITAREAPALKKRMSNLGITHCFYGVSDKLIAFHQLLTTLKITKEQCIYTGDDVIDLSVMAECGLSCSVNNGHFIVKHHADWVSPLNGGNGAARSICDVLLYSQDNYPISFQSSQ